MTAPVSTALMPMPFRICPSMLPLLSSPYRQQKQIAMTGIYTTLKHRGRFFVLT